MYLPVLIWKWIKLNEKVFVIQKMSKFEIGGWNGMAQREKGC